MHLQESGEMYLETIYVLSKSHSFVRSIDICDEMGFSKPSVSRAVGLLKSGGYITVDEGGHITLTEIGYEVAYKIYRRHEVLTKFLISIGVPEEIAQNDACRIEHDISDETFSAIESYTDKKS